MNFIDYRNEGRLEVQKTTDVLETDLLKVVAFHTPDMCISERQAKVLLAYPEALALRDYLNEQYPAWVSVEDSLPDEEGLYIVDVGCVISAYWQNNDWYDVSTETKDLPDIAYWRPLPNPPKGKDDE